MLHLNHLKSWVSFNSFRMTLTSSNNTHETRRKTITRRFLEKKTSVSCSPSDVHAAVNMNLKDPCLFGMQYVLYYFSVLAA